MQTGKIYFYIPFLYIKELTRYYQKKNKERLSKKAGERYQNISEEKEKDKKRQNAHELYRRNRKEASIGS